MFELNFLVLPAIDQLGHLLFGGIYFEPSIIFEL